MGQSLQVAGSSRTKPVQAASPRLRTLVDEVGTGIPRATEQFWADVRRCGTPLIERVAESDRLLVTFLWRDDGATRNVVVVGGPTQWDRVEDDRMSLLPDTDVWYRSYLADRTFAGSYQLSVNDSLVPPHEVTDWTQRQSTFRADPLNRSLLQWREPVPGGDGAMRTEAVSWMALPDAPDASILHRRPDVARGTLTCHEVPGAALGAPRRVWVHTPPQRPTGVLVVLDGGIWAECLPIADLLDNLRADGTTGALLVVLVDAVDDATRMRELACHEPFARFLDEELVAWVHRHWSVPRGPDATAVLGQSLGGLTAVSTALRSPAVFGTAIAQSGSFWWPRDPRTDRPLERLVAQVRQRPAVPVRLHLEVGDVEGADMLPSNRHMRDALRARGFAVSYHEFHGGHDWARWRLGMATALAGLGR